MDEALVKSAAVVYERLCFRPMPATDEHTANPQRTLMERMCVDDFLFVHQLQAVGAITVRCRGLWWFVEQYLHVRCCHCT